MMFDLENLDTQLVLFILCHVADILMTCSVDFMMCA